MLLTNYILFVLLGAALFLSRFFYEEDTQWLDIAGATIILVLGVTLIAFDEGITRQDGFTQEINTSNASAASPDKTVTRTPVYEEISSNLSIVLQWVTLLAGIGAMLVATLDENTTDSRVSGRDGPR